MPNAELLGLHAERFPAGSPKHGLCNAEDAVNIIGGNCLFLIIRHFHSFHVMAYN